MVPCSSSAVPPDWGDLGSAGMWEHGCCVAVKVRPPLDPLGWRRRRRPDAGAGSASVHHEWKPPMSVPHLLRPHLRQESRSLHKFLSGDSTTTFPKDEMLPFYSPKTNQWCHVMRPDHLQLWTKIRRSWRSFRNQRSFFFVFMWLQEFLHN